MAPHRRDGPARITADLRDAFRSGDVVFSCGGIGATPDDHTRGCAGAALGRTMELHEEARRLITERMREVAAEQGRAFDPEAPDNVHRYNMGVFPQGATLIPNPYNRIPGFSLRSPHGGDAAVHFVPGFPVMAWPMIEWVLDTQYAHLHQPVQTLERSVIVYGALEAALTPLMLRIEAAFEGIKVFSLPSVDHPVHGRHIELGVKGSAERMAEAYEALKAGLAEHGCQLGPELVR